MDFDPEKYRNPLPYPEKRSIEKKLFAAIDQQKLTAVERKAAYEAAQNEACVEYSNAMTAYRVRQQSIHSVFTADAEENAGFSDLPDDVKSAIHSYCWEGHHSCGLSEVWNGYYDIVDFVRRVRK